MDSLKTIKVLYIEDDESHADMIRKMLNKSQYIKFDVTIKENLELAISYLNSIYCNIDVVLLDLILPNSEGVATFEEVYSVCENVPIVIISGYEDIAYSCISLGAQDYLVKPDISPGLISRSLEYAIERYKTKKIVEESEKRFRLLSEASFEGVTITRDGIFLDSNEQFAKMVDYSVDELIGMKVTEFVASEHRDLVLTNLSKKHEGPYEHMARKKDGTIFPVEIHGRTLSDGLRLTAIRNMSRYREAEEALEEEKRKKEKIFNELESRIQEWKEEIAKTSIIQQHTIRKVSAEIECLNDIEVHK